LKVLQINTSVNSGSTGKIAEDIGNLLLKQGHESSIAYGRGNRPSGSKLIKIGSKLGTYFHWLLTALFDKHGFGSKKATLKLINQIEIIKPDIIGLHNIHGYYINIEILFEYLQTSKIPIVWTLHDCWAFTGHCTYFDSVNCEKWKTQCFNCPKTKFYPTSYLIDNSKNNYSIKKVLFNLPKSIQLITPSNWLNQLVKQSFLTHPVQTIYNGIDLTIFKPNYSDSLLLEKHKLNNKLVVLGVASIWDKRKGLDDFIALSQILDSNKFQIILIGLSKDQITNLPSQIIGIERTENVQQLAEYYSLAYVFINPTWQDNFPTTNIESLACGTPVITYNTGGSPEAIDDNTGIVVKKGDIKGLEQAIHVIIKNGKSFYQDNCRKRAELLFDKNERYLDYIKLFESILIKEND
jgi:putative colanic acid biosynthesis glycosyltransferase